MQRHAGEDAHQRRTPDDQNISRSDTEDVAEEERREIDRERPGMRHDHHTRRQHDDELETDAHVPGQSRRTTHDHHPEGHDHRTDGGTEHEIHPGQGRHRHPRQHAVTHGVAEEGQSAQHHPGADAGAEHCGETAGHQGPEHEGDLERAGQDFHVTMIIITIKV